MSTNSPSLSPSDRARQYIDDVIKINREHGMRSDTSRDAYSAAVASATDAARLTHSVSRSEQIAKKAAAARWKTDPDRN